MKKIELEIFTLYEAFMDTLSKNFPHQVDKVNTIANFLGGIPVDDAANVMLDYIENKFTYIDEGKDGTKYFVRKSAVNIEI